MPRSVLAPAGAYIEPWWALMHPSRPACGDRVIVSREDAGNALRDLFLANADRGDNAANDQLIDALMHRIRELRASGDGGR